MKINMKTNSFKGIYILFITVNWNNLRSNEEYHPMIMTMKKKQETRKKERKKKNDKDSYFSIKVENSNVRAVSHDHTGINMAGIEEKLDYENRGHFSGAIQLARSTPQTKLFLIRFGEFFAVGAGEHISSRLNEQRQ